MSLSSLIVEREVATMRQVEEALARQVIYGGDLTTNLLEVTLVDEAALARAIAESAGLPAAPAGELPVSFEPAQLVPPEMATQREMVPIALEPDRLVVAVAHPLPRDVERQLAFALGMDIDQRTAPSVRIRQAIARVYGLPLDRRTQRVLSRLSGIGDAAESVAPNGFIQPQPEPSRTVSTAAQRASTGTPPLGSSAVRSRPAPKGPPSTRPSRQMTSTGFPAVSSPAAFATGGAPRSPSMASPGGNAHGVDPVGPPAPVVGQRSGLIQRDGGGPVTRSARRRRGPLTLDDARREAETASGRDALLNLFFDFSRQFFDFAALFLVHGDIAEGRDAFGTGAPHERVVGIGVPLDMPSLLSRARDERTPIVGKPPGEGLDAVLLADLQRPRDAEMATVPLVLKTRVVAILVGDCGEAGVEAVAVDQVTRFAAVVAEALERIIVRRKLEGFVAASKAGENVDGVEAIARSAYASSTPPAGVTAVSEPMPRPSPLRPMARPTSIPPPVANVATVRRISGPPIPREEPESPRQVIAIIPPAADASVDGAAGPPPDETAIPAELDARALFDMLGWETGTEEPEAAPESSSFAVPPHRPPVALMSPPPLLPSVIVDLEEELASIVDRVVTGDADESAEAELLRQGEHAMQVIMARFPGPLSVARSSIVASTPVPPRASECGPLLRLVARERKVALPFVLERLSDPDPETRGWATHLICELPYAEAIPYVLERLRDQDACTRASALHAVAAIARTSPVEVREALEPLLRSRDPADRVAALRAMGALRETVVVAQLIGALDDHDERVAVTAQEALVQVTCQDFGSDRRPWLKWWEPNASRHRIEWLIDALTHEIAELRRAAGEELRAVTREYFGYSGDLPARDRDRAQQRYRDWWVTEGRLRFYR
jgi:Type II secretion system (T2SS), protein E, N-terminal domain